LFRRLTRFVQNSQSQCFARKNGCIAVNHGPRRAIKILQTSLRLPQGYAPVAVDGIIGPQTLTGIDAAMAGLLINLLVDVRVNFYRRIVDRDRS